MRGTRADWQKGTPKVHSLLIMSSKIRALQCLPHLGPAHHACADLCNRFEGRCDCSSDRKAQVCCGEDNCPERKLIFQQHHQPVPSHPLFSRKLDRLPPSTRPLARDWPATSMRELQNGWESSHAPQMLCKSTTKHTRHGMNCSHS